MSKPNLRILSLGAGVQSSTLALMIEKGLIPKVDAAIFSDTMAEPVAVYDFLKRLQTKVSYPVYKVSFGDLRKDTLDSAEGRGRWNFLTIPLFTVNSKTGKKGILRRQCTGNYKINPVQQKIRELLGLKKGEKRKKGTKVELIMGISYDEITRMAINRIKWIQNVYPLIDLEMKRADCIKWFTDHYNVQPPRSACTFCPYKTNTEWLYLKNNYPKEWADVVELDKRIRTGTKTEDKVYIHKSCKPLGEVDLEVKQNDLFEDFGMLDECEGMCGV